MNNLMKFSGETSMRTKATLGADLARDLTRTTQKGSVTRAAKTVSQDDLASLRQLKLKSLRGQVRLEDNWQRLRQLDTAP